MRKYCLALDLRDDPTLIAAYEDHHRHVWPEIIQSIHDAGIVQMEIYRVATRLFMIMEVSDTFSFEAKAKADAADPAVQRWENLMSNYQQHLSFAPANTKWVLMDRIFKLT
jgi:L-rhamnose mutarotase